MNNLEEREEIEKEKASVASENLKKDVSHFDWKSWITEVRRYGSTKHPYYEYQRETVRNWLSFRLRNW